MEIQMNTMLKSTIILLLGLCSVSAFATNTVSDRITGQSDAEPSINPQPLPPHDPHPDGMKPKPQVARSFGAIAG
jgi:hypothetical protein